MRELTLKQFFTGDVSAKVLAQDLMGSMITKGDRTKHPIEDMDEDFQVWPDHLIRLCDAVLGGEIEPEHLQSVGFCLVASEHFKFDTDTAEGDLADDTANDWSAPEINYPLTLTNVEKFRHRLVTGENLFTIDDAS